MDTLNYIENTGWFRNVGIMEADEETACRKAMEVLGTETTPVHTVEMTWGWEITFDVADL